MKKVLEGIGVVLVMIGLCWVPESDVPKVEEESIFADAVTIIYSVSYTTRVAMDELEEAQKLASELAKKEAEEIISEEEKIEEEANESAEEALEEATEEAEEAGTYDEWGNELVYIGAYDITAYEWTGNPCANGNYPTEGYTVACNSLPLGTVLYIDGVGYRTVEDRGATWHSDYWIDLYLGDVGACYEWGIRTRDVWIVY